jgi:hypothetical protein
MPCPVVNFATIIQLGLNLISIQLPQHNVVLGSIEKAKPLQTTFFL